MRHVWLVALLVVGCSQAKTDASSLLDVAVRSSAAMELAPPKDAAERFGAAWQREPTSVALAAVSAAAPVMAMTLEGEGENPTALKAVIIVDRFSDDSVRGTRYELELQRDASGLWRVVAGTRAHRCWDERGHTYFGTEPCS